MGWIKPEAHMNKIKILLLGDYGTGKSYFASTCPEPIFLLDFDKGAIGYANKQVYVPDCFNEVLKPTILWNRIEQEIDLLIEDKHPEGSFRTLVLDSLTTATKYAMDMAIEKRPLTPDSPPVWNVHYPMVKVYMDRLLDKFKRLSMNIIVIGHVSYDKNDITGEIIATPAITGNLKTYIPALFDEVYFAEVLQTKDGRQYILNISPKGFKRARSRLKTLFNLPDQIPNSYKELEKFFKAKSPQGNLQNK